MCFLATPNVIANMNEAIKASVGILLPTAVAPLREVVVDASSDSNSDASSNSSGAVTLEPSTDAIIKSSFDFHRGRYSFKVPCTNEAWESILEKGKSIQGIYSFDAVGHKNRQTRLFQGAASFSQFLELEGVFDSKVVGYPIPEAASFMYVVIGSLPIVDGTITEDGILPSLSWNGERPTYQAAASSNSVTVPVITSKDGVCSFKEVSSNKYIVTDTKKNTNDLILDAFIVEWRRCHDPAGHLHVHIPCVVFGKSHHQHRNGVGIDHLVTNYLAKNN